MKTHKKGIIATAITASVMVVGALIFRRATGTNEDRELINKISKDLQSYVSHMQHSEARGRTCTMSVIVKETGELIGSKDICEYTGRMLLSLASNSAGPIFFDLSDYC